MFTTWKVERIPVISSTLSWDTSTTYDLTEYYDPLITTSLGSGRDTFELKIINSHDKYDNIFQPNDKINIYRKINSTSIVSTDLLMNGIIQDVPTTESYNQNMIRLQGNNYTEALMSAIIFLDAKLLTIPQALQQSLDHLKAYLKPDQYGNYIAPIWDNTNPTVRTDGSAFPVVGETFYNKPLIQLFEIYSTISKTGDKCNYHFYVDKNNYLKWLPSLDTSTYTFNITDNYRSIKINRDTKDVKNFVIVKGGYGPDNKPIQGRFMDWPSISKNGMKFYFLTDVATTAKTINQDDMKSLGITTDTYPSKSLGSTYSFTTTWLSHAITPYAKVTVTTDAEYQLAIKNHMVALMSEYGNSFLNNNSKGKLKIDLTFQAGKGWNIGDVIQCNIPALSASLKNLRVQSTQYSTTEDSYSLVEDVGSL
jgi:hypothetical protein